MYPVDRTRIFLMGHSMGSGGTWYLGGKYAYYWRALAPMSGPFVLKQGYPWETVLKIPIFVTEGTNAASVESSRRLRDWMREQKGQLAFKEVVADHPGMVSLVLPDVFAFFDSVSALPVSLNPVGRVPSNPTRFASRLIPSHTSVHSLPNRPALGQGYFDAQGKLVFKMTATTAKIPEEPTVSPLGGLR
jgi:pimeloyl-ACP methyl ester carboxylesterase